MTTVDITGAIHGADGKFAGHIAGEPDDGLSLEHPVVAASPYADLKGKDRVEAMKADLEKAVGDLVESGQLGAYLDARRANGMSRWSTNNQMLAALQVAQREGLTEPDQIFTRMGTIDARGFRQWEKAGREVTKGQKALYILGPNKKWITEEDPHRPGKTRKKQITAGFSAVAVFEASQTEGEPIAQHPAKPFTGEVESGTSKALQDFVASRGFSYHEEEIAGCDPVNLTGTLAYVSPTSKKLVVDSRLSDTQKAQALAHEAGHIACGHCDGDAPDYASHRGQMESEAESFSYMVLRERGIDAAQPNSFSPGYVAGWSKGDPKAVTQALDKAGKAFNALRDEAGWE
ncbi:uncharacterized protein DUF955 [Branchiibius hedensis]|uniref:IrrE N-terminal-like domain-containing protein n=1 Tax=Branchiibius hedensis TaxID=672460 RepID=A0A2Y8ZT92_9MICO|nr:ImmA/IrrE family metallo-endopeptidase [Branchiibius hedensis]PWJ25655.1 uncharacterized protein DUF955 [Branchiibius hedensis]SSA34468.1 protein of unknown function [Branchiibius hedensis]